MDNGKNGDSELDKGRRALEVIQSLNLLQVFEEASMYKRTIENTRRKMAPNDHRAIIADVALQNYEAMVSAYQNARMSDSAQDRVHLLNMTNKLQDDYIYLSADERGRGDNEK